jgi:sortase A
VSKRVVLGIHRVLLAGGLVLLGIFLFSYLRSEYTQWAGTRELSEAARTTSERPVVAAKRTAAPPAVKRPRPRRGSVLGRFEVPRLKLSYVLLEGTDDTTLDKSIGHVEYTPLPGEAGNIGIAGHRNTHFKRLEWVRRGDEIMLSTRERAYRYIVESVRLVMPENVEVLDDSSGPALTLVTCFPFEYVGSAPQRFIVRAVPDEETKQALGYVPAAAGGT